MNTTMRTRARTVLGLVTAAASSASPSDGADASAGAEPDLEGIPDVVAEVNGEEVTKEEFTPIYEAAFQQAAMQAQMSGEAPAEELLAAVEKQGITEEQARSQVETQVLVEQLVADEDGSAEPTENELRAIYAQAKQQQAQ